MCPSIPSRPEQQQKHPAIPARWLKPVLLFTILLALPHNSFAQSLDEITIRTVDMRGDNPVLASVAAIKNSRNHVVVVLIRGGNEELIDKTKGQLKAIVHRGFDRLGVILCDLKPGEIGPVIGIVSDGTAYAVIKRARPDTVTMWEVYNLVRDAYQDNILPKLNAGQNKKN